MNETVELKKHIQSSIKAFENTEFLETACQFWNVLGYSSSRRLDKQTYSYNEFTQHFSQTYKIRDDKALKEHIENIHILFQVSDEEIRDSIAQQLQLFSESEFKVFQTDNIYSYLFAAVEVKKENLTRTELANLTREINRCFAMPVLLLVKTPRYLNLTVIYRRRHKKDGSRDVLEKVSMLKDISFKGEPHRAHIEILHDLALRELNVSNFDELHKAWEKTFDLKDLNKRFYRELSNWFFWAVGKVNFPDPNEANEETRNSVGMIRLLTRIIFVWFMKEKQLIPEELFDREKLEDIIDINDPKASSYYKAILQNLFFATLNTEMPKDKPKSRRFRHKITGHLNNDYANHYVFRNQKLFKNQDTVIDDFFGNIPYLHGSLFECLDYETENGKGKVWVDGFSDDERNPLKVPNEIFLLDETIDCDLNSIYHTRNKRYKVKGLLDILHSYKFTIAENTPVEEEVALDPELLGRVFENLLAAYNPETKDTARKQTGSFYTPREVVDFMVNESIVAHLCNALPAKNKKEKEDNEIRLRLLLTYADEESLFSSEEADILISAIDNTKIIDPACGSGAFPMGLLLKMTYILHKLDPDNKKWKAKQIENLKNAARLAKKGIPDLKMKKEFEKTVEELKAAFESYDLDYSRKLFLIERCIYGVDIQPIAIQISQLRFFISLLVDQTPHAQAYNMGIEPLPNLETNLIAANSLIPINLMEQREILFDNEFEQYKADIIELHKEYFSTRSRPKIKKLRKQEQTLREEFSERIKDLGVPGENADLIATWNPFQSNTYSKFFAPDIMLGFSEFDIVIANPPYIRQEAIKFKNQLRGAGYRVFNPTSDLYTYFYELAYNLLAEKGVVTFITSNKWMRAAYGTKLRHFLSSGSTIQTIVDFGGHQVFESASVDTGIIVFQKSQPSSTHKADFINVEESFKGQNLDEYILSKKEKISQSSLQGGAWTLANENVLNLKSKIENMGKQLVNWDVAIYSGIKTGYNEAFVIDSNTKERLCEENSRSAHVIKPLLKGMDISKYRYQWADSWLIVIESGWTDKHRGEKDPEEFFATYYPAVHAHLKSIGDAILDGNITARGRGLYNRTDKGDYWWELRPCVYYDEFKKEKILWPDIAEEARFAYDVDSFFLNNTAYMITGNELPYILGVMNSKVFDFYYRLISSGLSGQANRGFKIFIEQYPIPSSPDENTKKRLEDLVMQVLRVKAAHVNDAKQETADKSQDLLSEIDRLVYKLYNLDDSEIELIEQA